jgi:FkbM family methyltransferase
LLKHLLHAAIWTRRHLAGELGAPELPALLSCLQPDDVFLDVGVHAGSWAIPASRALTSGHVYGFEAFPYYAKVLKTTLALLGRRNVTVVVGAVSDAAGEVAIVWRDAAGHRLTGMTHISRGSEAGDTVRVRALTIDDFCRTHAVGRVRLMKCDVEGAELMVLRGATATIEQWRPLVFCEVYEQYCAQYCYAAADVFSFFAARRYRSMQFGGGVFRPLDPKAYAGAGDVLFVPIEMELSAACA